MRSIAALALCPLLYGLPATAANLEAGYSVRWAGIEIARFEVELRTSPADYRLAYRAETTGALAWVFDFASDGSATGRLTPEGPIAGQYRGRSASDDHTSQWRVDFTADGAVSEVVLDEESRGDREPVPAELMVAPDPFTLALQGLLEAANEGTVFLDEVGELPMTVQVKLLRVLEERAVRRVGGLRSKPFDIRFVAATNRDLNKAIQEGSFRSDLFYRLNGISLVIPPLRQRVGEIKGLTQRFVEEASKRAGRSEPPSVSPEAMSWLEGYHWPGNIRELQNSIERAVLLCAGDVITLFVSTGP